MTIEQLNRDADNHMKLTEPLQFRDAMVARRILTDAHDEIVRLMKLLAECEAELEMLKAIDEGLDELLEGC